MRADRPPLPDPAPSERPQADRGPFILTAELPGDVFAWADGLRREHFPPERNHLAAHVTLFHAFAPSLREELRGMAASLTAEFAAPEAAVDGLLKLGGGTAIRLRSDGMSALRGRIAERFYGALTAQDRGTKVLHITVQNKVTAQAARTLQAELAPLLTPRRFAFTGLGLHIYRGPHWEAAGVWPFRGRADAATAC